MRRTAALALAVGLVATGGAAAGTEREPESGRAAAAASVVPVAGTTCRAFPADNYWNTDIRSLPVDPRSTVWLSHMSTGRNLHPDFGPSYGDGPNYGIPITVVGRHHARVRVRFEAGWGYSDAHIIELAAQERADLIVVGTHSRSGWQRFGHHSVSRGVLHYAPRNVACVPGHALQDPPLYSVIQNKPTNHQVHENRNPHPGRNDPQ